MKTFNDKDFSYQTLRASGPGGQHVNKTESAVRITHLPSGMSVMVSDQRSQLQNKKPATHALYACGMGSVKAMFGNQHSEVTPHVIFDNSSETVNKEAEELLIKAEVLAEQTLKEQRKLLLMMADYLSDKRTINKKQVKKFIEQYAVNFSISEIFGIILFLNAAPENFATILSEYRLLYQDQNYRENAYNNIF